MSDFIALAIKLFFLLTPFFGLTVFLAVTAEANESEKRILALKTTLAIAVVCVAIYFFGRFIFDVFGITLDAFRIGTGALLFLSAVDLVRGRTAPPSTTDHSDPSVVPLAIPVTVGPATTGALLVMGAANTTLAQELQGVAALLLATAAVGLLLFGAASLQRLLGTNGIAILSKLTGLILSALAAQIIFTGIQGFL